VHILFRSSWASCRRILLEALLLTILAVVLICSCLRSLLDIFSFCRCRCSSLLSDLDYQCPCCFKPTVQKSLQISICWRFLPLLSQAQHPNWCVCGIWPRRLTQYHWSLEHSPWLFSMCAGVVANGSNLRTAFEANPTQTSLCSPLLKKLFCSTAHCAVLCLSPSGRSSGFVCAAATGSPSLRAHRTACFDAGVSWRPPYVL